LQPIGATALGVHDYDAQLGDYSAAAFARALERDRAYLAQVDAIDPKALSPEVALDRTLLANALHDDLLRNGDLAQWRHNPDFYVNLASNAIFSIIEREYAPAPQRMEFAIARERALPKFFADAETNLTTVDATTAKLAYDDAVGSESFFATSVPQAFTGVGDATLRARLAASNATAKAALASYADWIKTHPLAHPSGTYAIGAKAYSELLKYEEALEVPLGRYLQIGEDALAATRTQYVAVAKQIDPTKTPADVQAELLKVHPTAAALKPTAQRDLIALRAFVIAHHIVTLPADSDITVVDTPEFERQTTFASMDAPGPLEKVATKAYYNITPVDPAWDAARKEQFLGFFNDYFRPLISAHEVMPGHFVNFVVDKHLPLSLTRRLMYSASYAEGWAHYDEQMMVDQGWGNGDPRVRLSQLSGALVRECRFIVGVKEHTQGMTVAAGTDFFMQNAFMGRGPASVEALRGTQDPTYGYYTLGKLELLKLRADMQKKLGSAYTLQKFHDAFLAHGDPPIPLLRPLLLGADDDGKVL